VDSRGDFQIRLGKIEDLPFIESSWCTSHAHAPTVLRNKSGFFAYQKKIIKLILNTPNVYVKIAHSNEDPDVIIGWACLAPSIIHYVYVRRDARRLGVANALLSDFKRQDPVIYTHVPLFRSIKLPSTWSYNPYAGN
jgi:hypothetical protein